MTIIWKIIQTDSLTANGFINAAHWTATAVDGVYTTSIYSVCGFEVAAPSIPYASVTEQEVLTWCWNNGVNKNAVEADLAAQIELQKNPAIAVGTPWSQA